MIMIVKDKGIMGNIEFKISKQTLVIALAKKRTDAPDINNTNIIDAKDIVFSIPYIQHNLELVASFLNVVIIKKDIKKAIIKDHNTTLLMLKILSHLPNIEELTLATDKAVNYPVFMSLLENKTIKHLNCYDIPKYLLERLDINKDLTVNMRSEILFISNFMSENKLDSYSDIFYAKNVRIYSEFTEEDYEDFSTFMNINNYVKTIYLVNFSDKIVNYVVNQIITHKKRNIKFIIKEKNNDLIAIYKTIDKAKKTHELYFKENDISFKMDYSPEYKKDNMFKQIHLNLFKGSIALIAIIVILLMVLHAYSAYVQERDIRSIENDLRDLINMVDREYTFYPDEPDFEFIGPYDGPTTTTPPRGPWLYDSGYFRRYSQLFETLREINPDTVGWLQVRGTRIDYPVVRANDNDFYLTRDFHQRRNSMGWVFMDFRNGTRHLDHNTIIYAHNINGGVMFGTLRYTLNPRWHTNEANQIITFNTPYAEMRWQIFSIYRIGRTTDYLITNFFNPDAHQEFLDMLRNRSIHDFGVRPTRTDRILTLSTCHGRSGADRLVVHAVLITE